MPESATVVPSQSVGKSHPPAVVDFDESVDYPSRQIMAYLGAVAVLKGVAESDEIARGRQLVVRLAADSPLENYPSTRLTLSECASIIEFVRITEPVNPRRFYGFHEPNAQSGLLVVLGCVADNVRRAERSRRRR